MQATLKGVQPLFYWKGMKNTVMEFIKSCLTCQRCKYDQCVYPGLLQPLPIPESIWEDISMDFIEGLPKSQGKEVLIAVVDRLSKYTHFLALSLPFSALTIVQSYLDYVYKLYGWPKTIVSYRDKVFISIFWSEFMKLQGVKFQLSTAYHPRQTVKRRFSTVVWKHTCVACGMNRLVTGLSGCHLQSFGTTRPMLMKVAPGDSAAKLNRYVAFDDNMEVVLKLVNEIHSRMFDIPDFELVNF